MDALQIRQACLALTLGSMAYAVTGCSKPAETTAWETPSRREAIVEEIVLPDELPSQSEPMQREAVAPQSAKSEPVQPQPVPTPAKHTKNSGFASKQAARSPGKRPTARAPEATSSGYSSKGSASQGNAFSNLATSSSAVPTRPGETARIEPPAAAAMATAAVAAPASENMPEASGLAQAPELATSELVSGSTLDSGDERDAAGYQTVDVFYATDRKESSLSLADFHLTGQRQLIGKLGMGAGCAAFFFVVAWLSKRPSTTKFSFGLMMVFSIAAIAVFATGQAGIEKTGVTYTGERGQLVRGVCQVTIPKTHTRGNVERPSLIRFEINEDSNKHIVLTSVTELEEISFDQQLQNELANSAEDDLLVFIHGYNVDFESAVHRTAQIAVDLPFHGVPVCYSWPSQGTLLGYPVDENNAAWTAGHLKEFLNELIDRSGAKSIHIIAHSMGNRAMTSALQQIALSRQSDGKVFDRVVLAAPDVDADLFRKDLAPALTRIANQVTLYASSDDQALIASKQVHGHPRAGETGDHLVVVDGVDTIDVSGIDLSLLGHSYYGDSEPMLRDLFDVLLTRLPANQRATLVSRLYQSKTYWQLSNTSRVATGVR